MNPNNDSFYKRLHLLYSFVCIVGGSLLWLVLCIPVVTMGPATMALYRATVQTLRRAEDHFLKTFWETFRAHVKAGAITGTVCIALAAFLIFCIRFANLLAASQGWLLLSYIYTGMLILLGIFAVFLFPALLHTEGKLFPRIKLCLLLALRHLFTALTCFLVWYLAGMIVGFWYIFLIFAPALCCFVTSLVLEPLLVKYDAGE